MNSSKNLYLVRVELTGPNVRTIDSVFSARIQATSESEAREIALKTYTERDVKVELGGVTLLEDVNVALEVEKNLKEREKNNRPFPERTKHTLGPWRIENNNTSNDINVAPENNRELWLCTIDKCITVDAEANARLIAAAPELLEALEALIGLSGLGMAKEYQHEKSENEVIESALKILSKARGES